MLLRCAQCETYRDVTVSHDVAKVYERDLLRMQEEMAAAADRSDRVRMAAEVRVFVAALDRDLIDASDFSPR
jgi:hypothetical protein